MIISKYWSCILYWCSRWLRVAAAHKSKWYSGLKDVTAVYTSKCNYIIVNMSSSGYIKIRCNVMLQEQPRILLPIPFASGKRIGNKRFFICFHRPTVLLCIRDAWRRACVCVDEVRMEPRQIERNPECEPRADLGWLQIIRVIMVHDGVWC